MTFPTDEEFRQVFEIRQGIADAKLAIRQARETIRKARECRAELEERLAQINRERQHAV